MITSDPVEIAWCAALFEGEGHIRSQQRYKAESRYIHMVVVNTDLDVLQRFGAAMGGRIVGPFKKDHPTHKPIYEWRSTSWPETEPIIKALYSQLMSRRRGQVDAVLASKPANLRKSSPWTRVPKGECPAEVVASQIGYVRHRRAGTEPCAICLESVRLYGRERKRQQIAAEGRPYSPRPWRRETYEAKGRKVA